jgi:phage-related protein
MSKLSSIRNKFKEDYQYLDEQIQFLENKLFLNQQIMIEYRRILSNYKYNGLITSNQIDLIVRFMQKYKMDTKDQIRILESIRIHNIKIKYSDSKVSYTVINMLDNFYSKYEIDFLEKTKFQDKFNMVIDSFYRSLKTNDSPQDTIDLMPDLDSGDYSLEEFDYIYKNILNRMIDGLNDNINSISDPQIYNDIELRKVVIEEYNENKYKYSKLLYSYNSKRQTYCIKLEKKPELESNETIVNNLFYQFTSFGESSYLEKDIKDFPEEYLSKVKQLLERKKYDKLSPDMDKPFNNSHKKMKEYRELRLDQIRIIYKHLFQNNYLIIGAFVKKTDNDRKMYQSMIERENSLDFSNSELFKEQLDKSLEVENRLYTMIDEKARKGSR